jgi:hypothetical protein
MAFEITGNHTLTDAEIDDLLREFDRSDRLMQRRIIARLMTERTLLMDAAKKVGAATQFDFWEMKFMLAAVVRDIERKS